MRPIAIAAPPGITWDQIKLVPSIRPAELRDSWTRRIGFPRPVEATLLYEGLYEGLHEGIGGVLLLETVTRWKPHRILAFTIRASTAPIPPATLDKRVTITNSRKPRDPLKQAPVIHALPILRGIQQDILLVIKRQCEQPYRIW